MPVEAKIEHMTPDARRRLEEYLEEVRDCLAGCQAVDPEDIKRDVADHIEREIQVLQERNAVPINREGLESILSSLGDPAQWCPSQVVAWWRRALLRLHRGPNDWRLAYLSLGALLIGLALWPVAGVVASFILARAALAMEPDVSRFRAQRWLIYPGLICVYVPLAFAVCVGPAYLVVGLSLSKILPGLGYSLSYRSGAMVALAAAGANALWALLARLTVSRWPKLPDTLFRPFGSVPRSRHVMYVAGLAAATAGVLLGLTVL
jgi:hypothetical protein